MRYVPKDRGAGLWENSFSRYIGKQIGEELIFALNTNQIQDLSRYILENEADAFFNSLMFSGPHSLMENTGQPMTVIQLEQNHRHADSGHRHFDSVIPALHRL